MENEIMNNEVVVEASEGISNDSGKIGVVIVGIGLTALVGGLLYKRVIKPIIAKAKAKKAKKKEAEDVFANDVFETGLEETEKSE